MVVQAEVAGIRLTVPRTMRRKVTGLDRDHMSVRNWSRQWRPGK
jgi:hypothetical protein